jgi:glutamyl-tRNA reductase
MASAAVALASKAHGGLGNKTVLLVGAGEMVELAARRLRQLRVGRILVVNRTLVRAEALAARVGGTAHPFEELFKLLATADVVVSGTCSPQPLFTRENMAAVLEARAHRPLVMVDLAVPRDIAPEVDELAWVRVHDVDGIQRFVAGHAAARAEEARKAEVLVAQEVARFVRERAVRHGVPLLARLRQRADTIARAEVKRTLSTFGEGLSDKQRESVEAMARAIVNKLLHEPTARLRALGLAHEDAQFGRTVAELFGLLG